MKQPIRFGAYITQNGRNGGLEYALRRMSQRNVDLGVFQETKVTGGVFARDSSRYLVTKTEAPSLYSDSVAVFYRKSEHFFLEALSLHNLNVVRFHLVTRQQRWHVAGCYIAPNDASTI